MPRAWQDFTGLDWWTHGKPVNYAQPNPAEKDISTWLVQNPQRLNLVRIGFDFNGTAVTEDQLTNKSQVLDLWTGQISSNFSYKGQSVQVETYCHPDINLIGFHVTSSLLSSGELGIFFDFPYPDTAKFDAPYVGVWNDTAHHNISGYFAGYGGFLEHTLDGNSYFISAQWDDPARVIAPTDGSSRHVIQLPNSTEVMFSVGFAPTGDLNMDTYADTAEASEEFWADYWTSGAFVDLSAVTSPRASELQRRVILSQYLTAVNSASSNPPQGEWFQLIEAKMRYRANIQGRIR